MIFFIKIRKSIDDNFSIAVKNCAKEGDFVPRRGENIYKRKDGRWEGRYIKGHVRGKAQYGYVYALSYAEVKEKLFHLKVSVRNSGSTCSDSSNEHPESTFNTIASEWMAFMKPQIKESSYVKYSNSLHDYLYPAFTGRQVSSITRSEVSALCANLADAGGNNNIGLSPKTIADTLSILRSIFNYASEEKNLLVANLTGLSVKLPRNTIRVFTVAEQQKLDAYLRENLTPCHLGILLCMYTGLRVGEICALTWKEISPDEPILHVGKTLQRIQKVDGIGKKTKVVISPPKSESSIRSIPLPDDIYCLLQENRRSYEAYLLTGMPDRFMEPRLIQNHFNKILATLEIEHANFHTLRHTFATRCVELGFDLKSLSEILGHSTVNITLNRYVHPSMDLKQKNMNMLSELFTVS